MISALKNSIKRFVRHIQSNFFLFGILSLVWFAFRTGRKPSRVVYPCQRIAASNGSLWLSTYFLVPLSSLHLKSPLKSKMKTSIIILALIVVGSVVSLRLYDPGIQPENLGPNVGWSDEFLDTSMTSKIFVVNGTTGGDEGVVKLIGLMGEQGLFFYRSNVNGSTYGLTGLISNNSVVIIKINSQWDQRGGTNTDLLRTLIQAILDHPDGFAGEIIVADNGQGRGSMDWSQNNAEDHSQSAQKVVDLFSSTSKVSAFLWDTIRQNSVNEYSSGDMNSGYVVNSTADSDTGLKISYPKFITKFGTYVSLKNGIWDPVTNNYDSEKLKIINVPVLKSHSNYGVTASLKNYMGVVSQSLTNAHDTVGRGGMGTEMAGTRFPTLNILDAIWVNAIPESGPWTPYIDATRINCIAASTDPVALDYWASKNILLQTARKNGYTDISSMDPNNTSSGSFASWLRYSMQEIIKAGFQATIYESKMTIHMAN